jgi:hypothetical protein
MEVCDFCSSLVLGGECTNLNCEHSRDTRTQSAQKKSKSVRKNRSKAKVQKKNTAKGAFVKHYQESGKILVPSEIHLKKEVSLPKFMGYKTDKKSDRDYRRSALNLLFKTEFETYPNALNKSAIAEFGPPNSSKRKTKILTWFDGRIYRTQSTNLQKSREKLVEDRTYVSENF